MGKKKRDQIGEVRRTSGKGLHAYFEGRLIIYGMHFFQTLRGGGKKKVPFRWKEEKGAKRVLEENSKFPSSQTLPGPLRREGEKKLFAKTMKGKPGEKRGKMEQKGGGCNLCGWGGKREFPGKVQLKRCHEEREREGPLRKEESTPRRKSPSPIRSGIRGSGVVKRQKKEKKK